MKNIFLVKIALMLSFCFGFYCNKIISKQSDNNSLIRQSDNIVKQKKVTGVAGIFFKCKDIK